MQKIRETSTRHSILYLTSPIKMCFSFCLPLDFAFVFYLHPRCAVFKQDACINQKVCGPRHRVTPFFTDSVPIVFPSLSLFKERPYKCVDDVRLVLLEPVTCSGDDVQAEVVADVEATGLGHVLFEEGISLTPQEQHGRAHLALIEREETAKAGKHMVTNAE